jgi:predicted transcriptional regulator
VFTKRQKDSIARRYKAGESSISIAEDYGVTSVTIRRLLRANGVRIKGRGRYKNRRRA